MSGSGIQKCHSDGSGYGACQCGDAGADASAGSGGGGNAGSGGGGNAGSGGGGNAGSGGASGGASGGVGEGGGSSGGSGGSSGDAGTTCAPGTATNVTGACDLVTQNCAAGLTCRVEQTDAGGYQSACIDLGNGAKKLGESCNGAQGLPGQAELRALEVHAALLQRRPVRSQRLLRHEDQLRLLLRAGLHLLGVVHSMGKRLPVGTRVRLPCRRQRQAQVQLPQLLDRRGLDLGHGLPVLERLPGFAAMRFREWQRRVSLALQGQWQRRAGRRRRRRHARATVAVPAGRPARPTRARAGSACAGRRDPPCHWQSTARSRAWPWALSCSSRAAVLAARATTPKVPAEEAPALAAPAAPAARREAARRAGSRAATAEEARPRASRTSPSRAIAAAARARAAARRTAAAGRLRMHDYGAELAVSPKGSDSAAGTPGRTLSDRSAAPSRAVGRAGRAGLPDRRRRGLAARRGVLADRVARRWARRSPAATATRWSGVATRASARVVGGRAAPPGAFTARDIDLPDLRPARPCRRRRRCSSFPCRRSASRTTASSCAAASARWVSRVHRELFVDGAAMTLARWPDAAANDAADGRRDRGRARPLRRAKPRRHRPLRRRTSEQDGVSSFSREGLVGGLQYHLYRHTWDYQNSTYTAWFLTTDASGYPTDTHPWWSATTRSSAR